MQYVDAVGRILGRIEFRANALTPERSQLPHHDKLTYVVIYISPGLPVSGFREGLAATPLRPPVMIPAL
jgi:hypothetical protein